MERPAWKPLLLDTAERAIAFLEELPDRPVGAAATLEELRDALGGALPDRPQDPAEVVAALAEAADPGLVATPSGRYFGFVIGGALPAAVAADWLTSAWDQNAGLYVASPAEAVVEDVVAGWLTDLLRLPAGASCGFVTGGQMANATCLAAARHHVLREHGWDVERDGLHGAPAIRVLVGAERHGTIDRSLRFLGIGTAAITAVAADRQGRMRPDALADALSSGAGPAIVCAQLGNVNTGALDPVGAIGDLAREHGAWLHVDGAFGLWAAVSSRFDAALVGHDRADSWATDAHKWLNVPYDCGLAFTRHPAAHRAAMGTRAAYLVYGGGEQREQMDWNPEHSRRGRGFAVYAALRSLGRGGVVALVERSCDLARRFAAAFDAHPRAEVLNDVVLNQVLIRLDDDDEVTRATAEEVQRDGTCWLSGTTWQGRAALRISVSNWSTDEEDVDRSVAAIVRCLERVRP